MSNYIKERAVLHEKEKSKNDTSTSSTNAQKDATIETGMLVRVPLFIEQDEEIIVSTKDGKYVSRK